MKSSTGDHPSPSLGRLHWDVVRLDSTLGPRVRCRAQLPSPHPQHTHPAQPVTCSTAVEHVSMKSSTGCSRSYLALAASSTLPRSTIADVNLPPYGCSRLVPRHSQPWHSRQITQTTMFIANQCICMAAHGSFLATRCLDDTPTTLACRPHHSCSVSLAHHALQA